MAIPPISTFWPRLPLAPDLPARKLAGPPAITLLLNWIRSGWATETQEFLFKGVKGRNIIGKLGSGPIIILGAHYDTRPAADHDPDPAKRGRMD